MRFQGETGHSLLSVLVGVGLLGLLSKFVIDSTLLGKKAQASLSKTSDRVLLERHLRRGTSCDLSLTPSTCPSQGPIEISAKVNGVTRTFISRDGTRFGEYVVRAECAPDNGSIIARAVRVRPGASLASLSDKDITPDPLTGAIVGWNDPRSLVYPAGKTLCPDSDGQEFAKVAYDSGWVNFSDGMVIQHNLKTLDYLVDLQYKTADGIVHTRNYGLMANGPQAINAFDFSTIEWYAKTSNYFKIGIWGQRLNNGAWEWLSSNPDVLLLRARVFRIKVDTP